MPDTSIGRNNEPFQCGAWEQLEEADPAALAIAAASDLKGLAKMAENFRTSLAHKASDDSRWSVQYDRKQLAAIVSESPRWQSCLRRYCERFHLPSYSP
jgi:hypothetical protein